VPRPLARSNSLIIENMLVAHGDGEQYVELHVVQSDAHRATLAKGPPFSIALGGWKTEEVLVTSYQQADAETIKNVVLHPTHWIVSR
jgi:hypothetical protein